ncbi:MAG TPA: type II secretion system protein GspC [Thermodesulfobacteriota bacterium]|nr:type II secretion system protein GspC [Thermodesulfobacteriota bacterium]
MKVKVIKAVNVFLSLCIILVAALLVRAYLLSRYMPVESVEASEGGEALKPVARKKLADYGVLLEAGVFGPATKLAYLDEGGGDIDEGPLGSAPGQDSTLLLAGTVMGITGTGYAIFEKKDSGVQELFRKGEKVFDAGVLTNIEKDRVHISRGGRTFTYVMPIVSMTGQPAEARPSAARVAPGPPASGDTSSIVSEKTGERQWIIDQRAFEKTFENMGQVLTDARLLPYSEEGEVVGFRLSEVRPSGVFALIGLKNGDVLMRVNDFTIDSPEKGMQLLSGLKGESSITVDIIRGGQPVKLNYEIR